jgi:signal peptidase II
MQAQLKRKIAPLFLAIGLVGLDQLSKALIVSVSKDRGGPIASYFGDFLYVVHQRNLGAAFSMADNLPPAARILILSVVPLAILAVVLVFFWKTRDLTRTQEWALMAIVGGGLGNIIDRLFRPLGVVDFISVKFYGLFGLERWPTFNVADSAVVIGSALIAVSLIAQGVSEFRKTKAARP